MSNEVRTIIVGDVHGCINELIELMGVISPKLTDHVVFCGDLVDKGPQPAAVVGYVRQLADKTRVTLVEGNHENKHRRWRQHEMSGNNVVNPVKLREHDAQLASTLSFDDIEFLDSAVLFHYEQSVNAFVTHAGVLPGMLTLPAANRQSQMSSGEWKYFKQMMYVRYVRGNVMVTLGNEQPSDAFWTDYYDGRFGTVYYGHQPRLIESPEIAEHAVGLDLGCCFGGRLAAAVLTNSSRQFVSVKAHHAYVDINSHMDQ